MSRKLEFWTPQFSGREKESVAAVLDSGYLNEGEVTAKLEAQSAALLGCKHVVATTSGTAAIFLSLAGLGIGPGDEVIVPDVTFIATANAVAMTGAKPVLADVDPRTLTVTPRAIESAITPLTKAVVPVHISGRAADLESILEIAGYHRLLVVEDAAEAFLSKRDGRSMGTFGIAGCFSLSPNKTITTGQGGLIATDDSALHTRLRELKDQGRPVRGTGGDDVHNRVGYNFKLTNLQAAVGLAQMEDLPRRLERMKAINRAYDEGLRGVRGISVLPFCLEGGEVPQWTDVLVEQRDGLYQFLSTRGIQCRRFWRPLHTQAPYLMPDERFPNSTRAMGQAMWLPSAFTLSDADVNRVCGEIRQFLK